VHHVGNYCMVIYIAVRSQPAYCTAV